jgi:hypothetical protein
MLILEDELDPCKLPLELLESSVFSPELRSVYILKQPYPHLVARRRSTNLENTEGNNFPICRSNGKESSTQINN